MIGRSRLQARHIWDALFIVALTAICLVGWLSTLHGIGLWAISLTTAAVGMAVVTAIVAFGGNLAFAVIGVTITYYLASGPVVSGLSALNSLSAFGSRIGDSADAWVLLLGTHPPIDATGTVMLAPTAVTLLGAGLAMALAITSDRPGAALPPLAVMFALVLLSGQFEPVTVLGQGLGFGCVALIWVRLRAQRVDEQAHGRDPIRIRRFAAATVMVTAGALLTAALTDPGDADTRLLLRDSVGAYDVAGVRTPLDDYREFIKLPGDPKDNLHKKELFNVAGGAGLRLRFATLTDYDGRHWVAANDTVPDSRVDRYLRISSTIDNPTDGPAQGKEIGLSISPTKHWDRPWVPITGDLQTFNFADDARVETPGNLRFNPVAQSAVLLDDLADQDAYSFVARESDGELEESMTPSSAVDEELFDHAGFVQPAVTAWTVGASTPMEAIFMMAKRLKQVGRYSDGQLPDEVKYTAGQSDIRLGDDFLLANPTVGNAEQYAAAMALLISRYRAPARVVIGAKVPKDGVVKGSDVEPWVEVQIRDGSWKILELNTFMGRKPPDRIFEATPPPRVFPPPPTDAPEDPEDEVEEPKDDELPPISATGDVTHRIDVPWRLLGLLLLGGAVAGVPTLKLGRRRRRLGARRVTSRFAGAWEELVDAAVDLGTPLPPTGTRPSQAAVLVGSRTDSGAVGLAELADVQIFGGEEPKAAQARAYWSQVRAEKGALASAYPLWRRVWAIFNPASLGRGRR